MEDEVRLRRMMAKRMRKNGWVRLRRRAKRMRKNGWVKLRRGRTAKRMRKNGWVREDGEEDEEERKAKRMRKNGSENRSDVGGFELT